MYMRAGYRVVKIDGFLVLLMFRQLKHLMSPELPPAVESSVGLDSLDSDQKQVRCQGIMIQLDELPSISNSRWELIFPISALSSVTSELRDSVYFLNCILNSSNSFIYPLLWSFFTEDRFLRTTLNPADQWFFRKVEFSLIQIALLHSCNPSMMQVYEHDFCSNYNCKHEFSTRISHSVQPSSTDR